MLVHGEHGSCSNCIFFLDTGMLQFPVEGSVGGLKVEENPVSGCPRDSGIMRLAELGPLDYFRSGTLFWQVIFYI